MGRHTLWRNKLTVRLLTPALYARVGSWCFLFMLMFAPSAIGADDTPQPRPDRQVIAGPTIFSDSSIKLHPVVSEYIEAYRSPTGLDYIARSLENARPYRDFIVATLAEYRLPDELKYLALVESSFDPRAVSRSGAVGIWQFMDNSVEDWMRITDWVDERRDFHRSTIAAAQKLARNFIELEDWLLAIAAYNAGLGHVQRAIESENTDDYWELAASGVLPDQTVDYVPKFLAITWIAERAGRHGLPTEWLEPLAWTRVWFPGGTSLRQLAEEMGIDAQALHSWNVHLNNASIPEGVARYPLNIPENLSDRARAAAQLRQNLLPVENDR